MKVLPATSSDEIVNSASIRSTRRKQEHRRIDTPELVNKFGCNVAKVLLARIGTPEMKKLTRSYPKASPMPEMPTDMTKETAEIESNADTKTEVEVDHITADEIVELTPAKPSQDITLDESRTSTATRSSRRKQPIVETEEVNTATPSTSKTPVSALRKRGKSALAKNSDALEQPIAFTDNDEKKDTKTNGESIKKAAGSKRVGTPLPANKKRAFLVGTAKLSVDSSNNEVEIVKPETNKQTESESDPKEKTSDGKPENDDETRKTTRGRGRKKAMEAIISTPTEKKAENSGTPLNKRNRNVKAAAGDESVPSASEQTNAKNGTGDSNMPSMDESQKAAAPAKATRRKRANTEVDVTETTPKKAKALDISIAFEPTPSSSRSLRRRAVVVSTETSSIATPKRTRQPRKRYDSEHEIAKKTGKRIIHRIHMMFFLFI